jgi:hypothetical protein
LSLGKYYRVIGDLEKMQKGITRIVKEHCTQRETPIVTPTPTSESVPVPEPVPLVIKIAKDNSSLSSVKVLSDVVVDPVEVKVKKWFRSFYKMNYCCCQAVVYFAQLEGK